MFEIGSWLICEVLIKQVYIKGDFYLRGIKLKNTIVLGFLLCVVFLVGCSNEQVFEEFFHKEMKRKHENENFSYALVHTELNAVQEEDAIAVFKEHNSRGEQIFIGYFEKNDNRWEWKQTRGAEWDTPHKWSAMHEVPYIYSGAISDNSIKEIYAGREKAKIIDVEGNKRYWYVISPVKEAQVKFVRKDGIEEIVESVDEEMLKDWGK